MKKPAITSWSGQEVVEYVNHELRQHVAVAHGYSHMLVHEGTKHTDKERDREWLHRLHEELWIIRALVDFFDTWGRQTVSTEPLDDAKIQVLQEHIEAYLHTHEASQNNERGKNMEHLTGG